MAGEVSKEELESILLQTMFAAKSVRTQRDRLLQLRSRLQLQLSPSDDAYAAELRELALDVEHIDIAVADRLNELAAEQLDFAGAFRHMCLSIDIGKVYFVGIKAGARAIATCLELAAKSGARLALNPAFASMPDEELFDALVALQLPARPTTQTEAFARVEAAFYAVKLSREHHLPRCVELLTGIPPPSITGEPLDEDDPVDAATEHLANIDLLDPAPPAAATGEPPGPLSSFQSGIDHDKARTYLDRACTLWSLAVRHIDLAVDVISSFVDNEEVDCFSDYTDRVAYNECVSVDGLMQPHNAESSLYE